MSNMLNLLYMCILISVVSFSKAVHLKTPNLTRNIEIREHLSATVGVGSHLYTIFYNTTHVRIKSTDREYRSCIFFADSFTNNRIYASVLRNKRRIVVWSIYRSEFHNKTIEVQSTMFLIDPWRCHYKHIPLSSDYQPRWYQRINLDKFDYPHAPQVVTYTDSFDVFFAGPNVCSPCRFNIDGENIKMHHQIDPDRFDAMEPSYVQAIDLNNGTRAYFQVYRFTNFTAQIRLLDSNFKVLNHMLIRHMVSLIDVDRSEEPTIVICYLSRYPKQPHGDLKFVYCKKYDTEFDRLFSVRLPMAVETYPAGLSLIVDSVGHTFVTYEAPYGNTTKLAVFQYDVEGNLTKSLDFSDFNGTKKVAQGSVLTSWDFCLLSWVKRNGKDSCSKIIECIIV